MYRKKKKGSNSRLREKVTHHSWKKNGKISQWGLMRSKDQGEKKPIKGPWGPSVLNKVVCRRKGFASSV